MMLEVVVDDAFSASTIDRTARLFDPTGFGTLQAASSVCTYEQGSDPLAQT